MPARDPKVRRQVAQIAALELHATVDGREHVRAAFLASPAQVDHWEKKVDPDGTLDPTVRTARAVRKRSAHMKRLNLASQRAKQGKRGAA